MKFTHLLEPRSLNETSELDKDKVNTLGDNEEFSLEDSEANMFENELTGESDKVSEETNEPKVNTTANTGDADLYGVPENQADMTKHVLQIMEGASVMAEQGVYLRGYQLTESISFDRRFDQFVPLMEAQDAMISLIEYTNTEAEEKAKEGGETTPEKEDKQTEGFISKLKALADKIWNGIKDAATNAWGAIRGFVDKIKEAIKRIDDKIRAVAKSDAKTRLQKIKKRFAELWVKLSDKVRKMEKGPQQTELFKIIEVNKKEAQKDTSSTDDGKNESASVDARTAAIMESAFTMASNGYYVSSLVMNESVTYQGNDIFTTILESADVLVEMTGKLSTKTSDGEPVDSDAPSPKDEPKTFLQKVKNMFDTLWEKIKEMGRKIRDGLRTAKDTVVGWVRGLIGTVKKYIIAVANWIINKLSSGATPEEKSAQKEALAKGQKLVDATGSIVNDAQDAESKGVLSRLKSGISKLFGASTAQEAQAAKNEIEK